VSLWEENAGEKAIADQQNPKERLKLKVKVKEKFHFPVNLILIYP